MKKKTTPKPPKRKFHNSVWVVDIDYNRKGDVNRETWLFEIDNYEGAVNQWSWLIKQDKKDGITSEMNDDIEHDQGSANSWKITEEPNGYTVEDFNGDFRVDIIIYEQKVHRRKQKLTLRRHKWDDTNAEYTTRTRAASK